PRRRRLQPLPVLPVLTMDPTTGHATRLDRLLAIGFVLCCLIPGLALLAGARPPNLENAGAARLPALTAGTVLDRETYAGVETYVAKNLPGRDIALRAYADLDYGLLRGTSS